MKQKYIITRNEKKHQLTIKEFAILEGFSARTAQVRTGSDTFSLLYRERYEDVKIKSAISRGKSALLAVLRTQHFFPIGHHADAIADTIIDIYLDDQQPPVELLFDDIDAFAAEQ